MLETGMIGTNKQENTSGSLGIDKQRSYSEVIELLDNKWSIEEDKSLSRMRKLDSALGSPSKNLKTILVAGSNGKSLTINFISQIFKEEGITTGSFYSPHFLTYNERICLNKTETIQNKQFTETANEVINVAEKEGINASSRELLTAVALKHFANSKVDVATLEIEGNNSWDPVNICSPKVLAVTRITDNEEIDNNTKIKELISEISKIAKKDTWVISADQSKISLQQLQDSVTAQEAKWAMPIRKLAPLPYPFEQLHGRCAALAERSAQIFAENWAFKNAEIVSDSLLIKPKGQRGRPTIEAKRHAELNPRKTLEQFWRDVYTILPGRFQLLDKEKPSILLDNSSNLDSLSGLLLGVRLLNYKKPFKGLTLIYNYENATVESPEFLKQIRYFFKKTAGQLILSPAANPTWTKDKTNIDLDKIINNLKNAKIKATDAKNFAEAFEKAKRSVDERNGLIIVTGGSNAVAEYWNTKGIKKL
jgi:folylpolyglutamate synthase/dihydrofolate synthase